MVLCSARANQRGLTLYELLITLAVAALLGLSAAGIADWVAHSRAVAQVNTLITHLNLARSEAIKRQETIVLCVSTSGETCTGGTAWSNGYIVFVDADRSKTREAEEPIVGAWRETGLRLEYRGFRSHSQIIYQPSGIVADNGTFTVCPRAGQNRVRTVVVSPTGRARTGSRSAAEAAGVCQRS